MAETKVNGNTNPKNTENLEKDIKKVSTDTVNIDTTALDAINETISEDKIKKPNVDIKSEENSISGIEDITSYIQKKKEKEKNLTTNPDVVTAIDGTDLTSLLGVYGVVPHKKGDHKIIYLRENAPINLIPDDKERKKGGKYIKKGHKVYDVYVDFMQHPTLRSRDGELMDVWIIDSPEDLQHQIQAIQSGVGGGTNFLSPIIVNKEKNKSKKEEAPKKEKKTSKKPKIKETPKVETPKVETPKEESPKEEAPKGEETQKREETQKVETPPFTLDLDDILPKNPAKEEATEEIQAVEEIPVEIPKKAVEEAPKIEERRKSSMFKSHNEDPVITPEEKEIEASHEPVKTGGMFRDYNEDIPQKEKEKKDETKEIEIPVAEEKIEGDQFLSKDNDITIEEKVEENIEESVSEVVAEEVKDENKQILDLDTMSFDSKEKTQEQVSTPITQDSKSEIIDIKRHKKPRSVSRTGLIIRIFGIIGAALLIMLIIKFSFSSSDDKKDEIIIPEEEIVNDTIIPEEKVVDDTDISDSNSDPVIIPDNSDNSGLFTINELKAKLESQQLESRRILNKAKLLGNKEAIKFGTTALLKATTTLDKIEKDSSITADEIQKYAERIDLYIGQADSIIH